MDLLCTKPDFRTANYMLNVLAAYGLDHHSRSLVRNMPTFVEKQISNLNLYIESRMLQTKECKAFTKGNLI